MIAELVGGVMSSFRDLTYNRYRSPLATAKLVEIRKGFFTLDFEGSYCRSCGVYDYFEDFIYELMDLADIKLEILSYKPQGPEGFRVKYAVKGQPNPRHGTQPGLPAKIQE